MLDNLSQTRSNNSRMDAYDHHYVPKDPEQKPDRQLENNNNRQDMKSFINDSDRLLASQQHYDLDQKLANESGAQLRGNYMDR